MPQAFELQNLIKDANTKVTSNENKERNKLLNTPPIIVTDERKLEKQSSSATTVEEGDVARQSNLFTNSEVCTALYGNYEFW